MPQRRADGDRRIERAELPGFRSVLHQQRSRDAADRVHRRVELPPMPRCESGSKRRSRCRPGSRSEELRLATVESGPPAGEDSNDDAFDGAAVMVALLAMPPVQAVELGTQLPPVSSGSYPFTGSPRHPPVPRTIRRRAFAPDGDTVPRRRGSGELVWLERRSTALARRRAAPGPDHRTLYFSSERHAGRLPRVASTRLKIPRACWPAQRQRRHLGDDAAAVARRAGRVGGAHRGREALALPRSCDRMPMPNAETFPRTGHRVALDNVEQGGRAVRRGRVKDGEVVATGVNRPRDARAIRPRMPSSTRCVRHRRQLGTPDLSAAPSSRERPSSPTAQVAMRMATARSFSPIRTRTWNCLACRPRRCTPISPSCSRRQSMTIRHVAMTIRHVPTWKCRQAVT